MFIYFWGYFKFFVLVCLDGYYGKKCEKICGKDVKCNYVIGECCGNMEFCKLGIFF